MCVLILKYIKKKECTLWDIIYKVLYNHYLGKTWSHLSDTTFLKMGPLCESTIILQTSKKDTQVITNYARLGCCLLNKRAFSGFKLSSCKMAGIQLQSHQSHIPINLTEELQEDHKLSYIILCQQFSWSLTTFCLIHQFCHNPVSLQPHKKASQRRHRVENVYTERHY